MTEPERPNCRKSTSRPEMTMSDGYWVVSVDRDTGEATTYDRIDDKDKAWEKAAHLEMASPRY